MIEPISNIQYANQSSTEKLDVYLPSLKQKKFPVIVWLHPGGFTMGDKKMVLPLVPTILERGYAVVSVNYRLAQEAMFPAQIYDAKAAVRWVRANAAKFRFDPERVAAAGISAGTTFAALLGTTAGHPEMEDLSMGSPDQSSHVSAVVAWYGPMDYTTLDAQRSDSGQPEWKETADSGEAMMLGGLTSEVPEKYRAFSPQTYINKDCPPFYFQHGTGDTIVPYLQSMCFAEALAKVIGKDKVTINLIKDANHFDRVHSSPENINASVDFLDKYLK